MILSVFRKQLLELNQLILNLYRRRSRVLNDLMLYKKDHRYPTWDLAQEVKVYFDLKDDLEEFDLEELLSFSLMIESQAIKAGGLEYPRWSQRVHLKEYHGELFEMVNPVLLRVTRPEMFHKLRLSPLFEDLFGTDHLGLAQASSH